MGRVGARAGAAWISTWMLGFASIAAAQETPPPRPWTFEDIVEVSRIASTAISADGRRAAYVVATPSLVENRIRYALMETPTRARTMAVERLAAAYISDVQWDPARQTWTVLADTGDGVQLYRVTANGRLELVVAAAPAEVGGPNSEIPSSFAAPRLAGVLAYGWNTDGSALWYVRPLPATPATNAAWWDDGVRYDPLTMSAADLLAGPSAAGIELRVVERRSGEDILVAAAPGDRAISWGAFTPGQVRWRDTAILEFGRLTRDGAGRVLTEWIQFSRSDRSARDMDPALSASVAAPSPVGGLSIARGVSGDRQLLATQVSQTRVVLDDIDFSSVGGELGAWRNGLGEGLYGVAYADRIGLLGYPMSAFSSALRRIPQTLSACSFDAGLTLGVCNRESQTTAPELVAVDPRSGVVSVLARPNARYDAIAALRTERLSSSPDPAGAGDGFVTYPRTYQAGRRFPAIVVTHASDAKNRFADPGFQWAFPLQVMAERGYVVVSVNERSGDPAAAAAYSGSGEPVEIARMQQAFGFRAVATMERAIDALVARGMVDPKRVGIAGYSRGGIVATLALSHSDRFVAGVSADTALFSSSGYWRGDDIRIAYRALFGGPPSNPKAQANYRALSPSWRADRFSGPLMQLMTSKVAPFALELDTALREAGQTTELIAYPEETHVLHRPRSRQAAMSASLDWFDFWLLGRCKRRADLCQNWGQQVGTATLEPSPFASDAARPPARTGVVANPPPRFPREPPQALRYRAREQSDAPA